MTKRSTISIIFLIVFLTIIGIVFYFGNGRFYKLNLPETEKLESISLEQESKKKTYSDKTEIEDIIYVIKGNERTTKKESIQDYPVNSENIIKVEFHFIEQGSSILFVYNEDNKYFIEQPYNGIYQISEDEYNSIEKYIR